MSEECGEECEGVWGGVWGGVERSAERSVKGIYIVKKCVGNVERIVDRSVWRSVRL